MLRRGNCSTPSCLRTAHVTKRLPPARSSVPPRSPPPGTEYIASHMSRVPPAEPSARLMRAVLPYLMAVAAISAGVLLRQVLARALGAELPFITLFPAVFVVAYFLGFGPTLLAT